MDKMLWNVSRLSEDYRKRGNRARLRRDGAVQGHDHEHEPHSSAFYFFYALILCNAWLLANLILAKTFSKFLTEPILRVAIVKAVTRSIIVDSFRG